MKISTMAPITPIKKEEAKKRTKWLTQKEAADYLGISVPTISNKSRREIDPIPYRKLDGKVQYPFDLLQEWEKRNTVSNYEEA